jgi:hypothetical protein
VPNTWMWRPWDQTRAVDNARAASTHLSRARIEREIDAYIERVLSRRLPTQSA